MRRNRLLFQGISLLVAVAVMLSVTSCGTILYPERRGQPAGRIDAGVAVMDGIGLLLFFVPGVIAFAVDFATGAIYLPPDSSRLHLTPSDLQNARITQIELASLTRSEIESLVEQEIGQEVELTSSDIKVARVVSGCDPVWGGITEVLTPSQLAAFVNN
jgi:hypothetical protein